MSDKQRELFLVPLLFFLCLSLLSAFSSEQLNEDSYQHFQTSVEVWKTSNWKELVTDTWNRPFSAFFYGIAGQQGLTSARLVSVFLAFLTSLGIYKIICCISKHSIEGNFLIPIAVFFGQLPILPESFVTMTEIPAAFLLAWGVFFHCARRHFWSFLVLGLLPLARLEMSLMTAWLFVMCSLQHLQKANWEFKAFFKAFQWCCIGSLPFVIWWLSGYALTGRFFWLLPSSSIFRLREFQLDFFTINALTSLNGVLSSSALLLFLLGFLQFPRVLKPAFDSHLFVASIYGVLVIYLIFASLFIVYPEGSSVFGDLGITAVNPRNFNVISPIFALFIFAGMTSLVDVKQKFLNVKKIWVVCMVVILLIIGFFFFQQTFGTSLKKGLFKLSLQSIILLALMSWLACRFLTKRIPLNLTTLSLFLGVSFVVSVPLFWHPLKFYDQRFLVQKELCLWLETQEKAPVIVQDTNSRLDQFCQLSLNAQWEWSQFFERNLKHAPVGSLVILEADQHYVPHARYSRQLVQLLQSGQYAVIQKSQPITNVSSWQKRLNQISARNKPITWIVYQKRFDSQ